MSSTAALRFQARIEDARQKGARELDLSGFGLKILPSLPAELRELRGLNLSSNRLQELPGDVWEYAWLEMLDLGNNRISELPSHIGRLASLQCLDVSENRLAALPSELGGCLGLKELHLFGNQLKSPFGAAAEFEQLVKLDVSKNRLEAFDYPDRRFPNLRELDLSNNLLASVPEGIAGLSRLKVLNLSGNKLTSAATLAKMPQLEELYLDDNLLAGIPAELAEFPSLRVFSATGNPFGQLPPSFDKVSAAALRAKVEIAVGAHISGGAEPGKRNAFAPGFFFDFFLAIGGFAGVLRFVDLYYKRAARACSAMLTFPDGSTIALNNLSRKTAMELVRGHEASISAGRVLLDLGRADWPLERQEKSDLILQAVSRAAFSELIPKMPGQPVVQFNNYNLIDNSQNKEVHMGDQFRIGSITGSNVNLKSNLENVQQTIGAAAAVDESTKAQLNRLIEQLSQVLEKLPSEKKEDAEAITEAAGDLVKKATKEKPNKKSVEISATGLIEAAKGIAGVVPIAIEIVNTITRFIAGS